MLCFYISIILRNAPKFQQSYWPFLGNRSYMKVYFSCIKFHYFFKYIISAYNSNKIWSYGACTTGLEPI